MLSRKFVKSRLALSIGVALCVGAISQASAQGSNEPTAMEETVVTGIRGSLRSAAEFKRATTEVVEAITSEDIGKFPDSNLAEALSRVVGVAIERNNIEGSKISVRGLGPEFNLVTLNGRQMPTVPGVFGGGRSFDFGDVSAHGFERVEVFKSTNAALPTGGIGATVNIVTGKPLNAPGFRGAFGAKAVDDSTSQEGDLTPEFDFLLSNTFADDKFGILLSGTFHDRQNREEGLQEQTWFANTSNLNPGIIVENNNQRADGTIFTPERVGFQIKDNERTRTNGQLTLQYAPTDTFTITTDYTYSHLKFSSQGHQFGTYLGGFGFTSAVVNENGVVTDLTANGDASYGHSVIWGSDENTNKSVGLNLDWQVNDNLNLQFDGHDSSARKEGTGIDNAISYQPAFWDSSWGSFPGQVDGVAAGVESRAVSFGTSDVPTWDIVPGPSWLTSKEEYDAYDFGSTNGTFRWQEKENNLSQFQIRGTYNFDGDGPLKSIQFGVSRLDQEIRDTRAEQFIVQGAANDGSASVLSHFFFDDEAFERVSLDGFVDGLGDGTNPVDYFYAISPEDAQYAFSRAGWTNDFPWAGKFGTCETILMDAAGTGFIDPNTGLNTDMRCSLDPGGVDSDSLVEEEQTSLYAQFNFEHEIGDMILNIKAGARYEDANTTSTALARVASDIAWDVNGFSVIYDGDSPLPVEGSSSNFLPNLNISLGITDNQIVRFAASKSIARAGLNDLRSVLEFQTREFGAPIRATSGNPDLKPLESENFDIAYENYYADGSYFSLNYFRKNIDNFLGSQTNETTYGTLTDPFFGEFAEAAKEQLETVGPRGDTPPWVNDLQELWWNTAAQPGNIGICYGGGWVCPPEFFVGLDTDPLAVIDLAQPVNRESGTVDGWEIAIQHMFGDSGFGVLANATFVGGDVEVDRTALGAQFALEGFGDASNLSGFYEGDRFTARLSYNERDETFVGFDGQTNPIFVEKRFQVDANASYQATDNLSILFEARNLTDEPVRLFVRHPEMIFLAQDHGPMYKFGFNYAF